MRDSLETKFSWILDRECIMCLCMFALASVHFCRNLHAFARSLCGWRRTRIFYFQFSMKHSATETLLCSIESYVIYVHRAFLVNAIKIDMLAALLLHWRIHIDTYMALCQWTSAEKKKMSSLHHVMNMLIPCTWQNICKLKSWIISRVETEERHTEHVQLSDAYAYLTAQRLHRFKYRFNPREELKLMYRLVENICTEFGREHHPASAEREGIWWIFSLSFSLFRVMK